MGWVYWHRVARHYIEGHPQQGIITTWGALPMEHNPLRHSRDGVLGLIQRGELRFDAFIGESHVGAMSQKGGFR